VSDQSLIEALRRRKFSHWILAYAAAAWAVAEATGFAIDNYAVPRRLLDVVLFLILVFFFVLIVLVWCHGEQGPQRVSQREGGLLGVLFAVAAIGSVWIATADRVPAAAIAVEDFVVADHGEG
jgi:CBS domain containing-hemolysin-like protein